MANPPHAEEKSVFAKEFDEETQKQLTDEDSYAWRSVTGLLIAIISVGLLIAIIAVSVAK